MTKLVLAVLLLGLVFQHSAAHAATAPVYQNPALAASYDRIVETHLGETERDPAKALTALAALRKKDVGNGLNFYLTASAYAFSGDWEKAAAWLEKGNQASRCVQYQRGVGPNYRTVAFPTFRQFARACRDQAPVMDPAKAISLLRGVRVMGAKVCATEPQQPMSLFVGLVLRKIVNETLVALQAPGSPEEAATTKLKTTDEAFTVVVRDEVQAAVGVEIGDAMLASAEKYGVTLAQLEADSRGGALPAAVKAKLIKLNRAMQAKFSPLMSKLLKSIPE